MLSESFCTNETILLKKFIWILSVVSSLWWSHPHPLLPLGLSRLMQYSSMPRLWQWLSYRSRTINRSAIDHSRCSPLRRPLNPPQWVCPGWSALQELAVSEYHPTWRQMLWTGQRSEMVIQVALTPLPREQLQVPTTAEFPSLPRPDGKRVGTKSVVGSMAITWADHQTSSGVNVVGGSAVELLSCTSQSLREVSPFDHSASIDTGFTLLGPGACSDGSFST